MDATRRNRYPVFCTIVPPHLLDRAARSQDTGRADSAQSTLEHDSLLRTRRRVTAVRTTGPAALGAPAADQPERTVYDAHHRTRLPGAKVRGEGDAAHKDATVNRAYAGLGATFELFLKAYGRHSIDDAGLALDASVHYGERYNNAFWDGSQMVFGDGDGDLFVDFTVSVDIIGHELTHGVTQHTANLDYYRQSGALNESMSDVFGSLIKQYTLGQTADQADWLIGAGLLGPNVTGVALRSMKAPGTAYDDDELGKDPQPATMDDYVSTSPTPASPTTPSTCWPPSSAARPGSGPGRSGTTPSAAASWRTTRSSRTSPGCRRSRRGPGTGTAAPSTRRCSRPGPRWAYPPSNPAGSPRMQ